MSGLVPTPITDKNGKQTTVHKKTDDSSKGNVARVKAVSSAALIAELNYGKPIILEPGYSFDFDANDGVAYDQPITAAEIYREDYDDNQYREDYDDNQYRVTGTGTSLDFVRSLCDDALDMEDVYEDDKLSYIIANSDTIDRFFTREYDITELDWCDDGGEASPKFDNFVSRDEPISREEAIDYLYEKTDMVKLYNESDPGTFGSRNLWRALAEDVTAADGIKNLGDQEIEELSRTGTPSELRAIAYSDRVNTPKDIVAQRNIVTNPNSPADAVFNVALNSRDESVQLYAVESNKMDDAQTGTIRATTPFTSVRLAIDDATNAKIVNGFQ